MVTPRISVLVPTAARPETLEVTLRSIARQTARAQIQEVIVSENLGDLRSREVCALFPELPIRYVLREPQLGALHFETLFREAKGEFSAFVCDDDLWSPGHLENALMSLDAHQDAVAHFSAFVGARSELAGQATLWCAPLLWLAAGRPPRMSEYVFEYRDALALSWVFTPFQWSTLVARTPISSATSPALTNSPHPFYHDRMFIIALAQHGQLIFDPAPDMIYRVYEGNWQSSQDPAHLQRLLREGEAVVAQAAAEAGVDLGECWRQYLAEVPEEIAAETSALLGSRFSAEELCEHGLDKLLPPAAGRRSLFARAGGRVQRAWRALMGRPV